MTNFAGLKVARPGFDQTVGATKGGDETAPDPTILLAAVPPPEQEAVRKLAGDTAGLLHGLRNPARPPLSLPLHTPPPLEGAESRSMESARASRGRMAVIEEAFEFEVPSPPEG